METKFNFKSAICTSRSQSERLLALGLKRETADMRYDCIGRMSDTEMIYREKPIIGPVISYYDIPAWSLHRLIFLTNTNDIKIAFNEKDCWGGDICRFSQRKVFEKDNLYDNLCDCFDWLIKEGYFNKEYLV